ncbi:MAG TPA: S41 family peptidase [Candidatus Polarisedimenticolaceae bacterium]|nr:S41 family peptidase [Candidatus Polarisedimenticolaceae bacterium]
MTRLSCRIAAGLTACAATLASAGESLFMRAPAISPDGQTIAFNYRGDLWTVPAAGGKATPLTLHDAYDSHPVWSRDGRRIAFASDRYGNFDVWVIPAAGGPAERLTFHSAADIPTAFNPSDDRVIFHSSRIDAVDCVQFPASAQPELYDVSLAGGMPRQLLTTPALDAVLDRDGARLAYTDRKGYENEWRKHDSSSFARDVWVVDLATGEHARLTEFGYDDRQPVWSPDQRSLFFLSERSGSFNVWRLDLDAPAEPEQITRHDTHPVRDLSIAADGTLAYSYDGAIYTRAPGARRSTRISVDAESDLRRNATGMRDVSRNISEFDVSPDGKEIVFVARGEIFVTSANHDATRQISRTPEQERSVSFHPNGRSLLYASERGGSWNLYRMDLTDEDELNFFNATSMKETPILEIAVETFQPRFSPDGKRVAYLKERTQLEVIDLESGTRRTILAGDRNYSYVDGDQNYDWSPSGEHFLVDFLSPTRWSREVGLVPSDGEGELVNLTRSGYGDVAGRWAVEGNAMFWYTDRWGGQLQRGGPVEYDVKLAFFNDESWDRYRLSEVELEQLTELEKRAKKDGKKKDANKDEAKGDGDEQGEGDEVEDERKADEDEGDELELPEPVELELDRLEDRTTRLTIHSSRLASATLTPDGERLLYLAQFEKGFDLWSYEHRKQEIKLLAKLDADSADNLLLDKEGKTAFLLADGSIRTVEIASGKVKPVSLSARIELDAAAERDYLYEHAWRQTLKKFHDVDMHGVDWKMYKEAYARFLPYVDHNRDFAYLLSELLGELNASHTGAYYNASRDGNGGGDETASLGLFPDPDWDGSGIRVLEILPKSPLTQAGSRIGVGTVIMAIDGQTIDAGQNWYPLLNHKAGQNVRLTLRDEQDETWEEVVRPIGSDADLLYERWVRSRRAEVDRLSGGRIGYAHIRGMNEGAFREIFDEIFGESVDKQAIVLDTRFNGGGNLDEALPVFLSGQTYMRAKPRGQAIGSIPERRWTKPSILIQNEGNYSDAHCVPNAYRSLGLGKTVGMQVPGTCTSVWWEQLQDPSITFGIPQVTWIDNAGDPLENKHFDPDFEIDNDPKLEARGRDQQLEKAVEFLLRQL